MIDLGPDDGGAARKQLAEAAIDGGFDPLISEPGLAEALAGESVDDDALALASAAQAAQVAFGALDCAAAMKEGAQAVGIAAARQAAGLDAPALPHALVYMLLCAARTQDHVAGQLAADRLRALGASPPEITAADWAQFPEVDAVIDRKLAAITISADVPGADVWVDFRKLGPAPQTVTVTLTEHVVAVGVPAGRRGWATGIADPKQTALTVPTAAHDAKWTAVAARVAGWHGARPAASELGWVLGQVHARIALIRHGTAVEVWGRAGLATPPRLLGDADGKGTLADASRLVSLAADREQAWDDHAPDPDQPLLLDDGKDPLLREHDEPTRWWVYAAVIGAIAAGGGYYYFESGGTDRQRVEVHLP